MRAMPPSDCQRGADSRGLDTRERTMARDDKQREPHELGESQDGQAPDGTPAAEQHDPPQSPRDEGSPATRRMGNTLGGALGHARHLEQVLAVQDRVERMLDPMRAADARNRQLEEQVRQSVELMRMNDAAASLERSVREITELERRATAIDQSLLHSASFRTFNDSLQFAAARYLEPEDKLTELLRSTLEVERARDARLFDVAGFAGAVATSNAARALFDFAAGTLLESVRMRAFEPVSDFVTQLVEKSERSRALLEGLYYEMQEPALAALSIPSPPALDAMLTTEIASIFAGLDTAARQQRRRRENRSAATHDGDAVAMATVAVDVWQEALARLPDMPESLRSQLLSVIVAILIAIFTLFQARRIADEQDRSSGAQEAEVLRAISGLRQAVEHAGQHSAARLVALRDLPLRDNPDVEAPRVGTIKRGTELTVQDQIGRWRYVTDGGNGDAAVSGWVYYRNLRPLPEVP